MVVEDDEVVRDLVVRILQTNGYHATGLADAALADADLPDVCLLLADVVLRDRSGPVMAARLRARHPGLRVLFMSGYSDARLRQEHGIDASTPILQKPFTAVELLGAVSETLSTASTIHHAAAARAVPAK
jgi:FixJ family two-component response regulator